MSNYNPIVTDVEAGVKSAAPTDSMYIHRHPCQHCGKACEKEIAPELLQQHAFLHHPPKAAWHAIHSQNIHYTLNVLLVAIVIFLTFFAAKFLFGK